MATGRPQMLPTSNVWDVDAAHCLLCVCMCAEPILQFLLLSLQQSPLATAAADALQCVCSQCPDQMTAHFDSLVRIVTDVNSFDVTNDAAIGLLKGTCSDCGLYCCIQDNLH